jgi:hypothetical protein
MKIACMQPYFLPYIGYWQLIHAVDKFVILDDVQFITRGWINRNKIIVHGKEQWLTIPLRNASRNNKINEIEICPKKQWLLKFNRTLDYAYQKAPFFELGKNLLDEILKIKDTNASIFLRKSIQILCNFLQIETEIEVASEKYPPQNLTGKDRIINICRTCKTETYVNAKGGKEIYSRSDFLTNSIDLRFIENINDSLIYSSIIDEIMNNQLDDLRKKLTNYSLT